MTKKKWISLILYFMIMAVLIIFDQYTKSLAILHLKNQLPYPLVKQVLELHYLENHGAAFGMLQNRIWFFVIMAAVIVLFILLLLIKMPADQKYLWMKICLLLIACGAVGNMIDRIRLGYVVDFIYFVLINFPIFNVADIYVTVGTALLIILILFYYKEDDLTFLSVGSKHSSKGV